MTAPRLTAMVNESLDRLNHPQPLPKGQAPCQTCHGTGVIMTRMTVIDGCGFPDGDWCPRCNGSGRVRGTTCRHCHDTGRINLPDVYGEYDDFEYCDCEAGHERAAHDVAVERARVDAEAFDQLYDWQRWQREQDAADADRNTTLATGQPF